MARVIEELKSITETDVYIVDDNFLVSSARVLDFCQQLKQQNIQKRFLIYGRADFIAAHPDELQQLRDVGLRAVIVGLESCLPDELEDYGKQTSLAQNEAAVAILQNLGIDCYATLILGLHWDKSHFRQLGDWLVKLGLQYVNLQPFTPMPGTQPYQQYRDQFITNDPCQWDLAHLVVQPTGLSQSSYYWQIIRLYWRIALHPNTILEHCRKYGLLRTARLGLGAAKVNLQYLAKISSCFTLKGMTDS